MDKSTYRKYRPRGPMRQNSKTLIVTNLNTPTAPPEGAPYLLLLCVLPLLWPPARGSSLPSACSNTPTTTSWARQSPSEGLSQLLVQHRTPTQLSKRRSTCLPTEIKSQRGTRLATGPAQDFSAMRPTLPAPGHGHLLIQHRTPTQLPKGAHHLLLPLQSTRSRGRTARPGP